MPEWSARLEEAIWAAIRDVLEHAVAFTPTVVTIEDALAAVLAGC